MTVASAGGRNYNLRPNGTLSSFHGRNEQAHFRPDGRVSSVHTANMDVRRGVHGERTVVSRRPNGTVVVRSGAHAGCVQRTVVVNRVSYVQRTYVVGGESLHASVYAVQLSRHRVPFLYARVLLWPGVLRLGLLPLGCACGLRLAVDGLAVVWLLWPVFRRRAAV